MRYDKLETEKKMFIGITDITLILICVHLFFYKKMFIRITDTYSNFLYVYTYFL